MLKFQEFLKQKRVFKLIFGALNQNYKDIEILSAIYAKAGCKFFDVSFDKEAVLAVKKGINFAFDFKENDCFICVSVGTKNDAHVKKCRIDNNLCLKCQKCVEVCIDGAIKNIDQELFIEEKKCVGCLKCLNTCEFKAISQYCSEKRLAEDFGEIFMLGIDCVEYHVDLNDKADFAEIQRQINLYHQGIISLCFNRSYSKENIFEFIKEVTKNRKPYTTIIQADGDSISGGCDNFKSNLQALAFVEMLQKENFNTFIIASGGVNSKFSQAANLFETELTGIAMGSFARKAVSAYVKNPDILKDKKLFEEAVFIAKSIVDSSRELKY